MIYQAKISDVKHWQDTPEFVQAQLVELIDAGDLFSAMQTYKQQHQITFADAKAAMVCLHYARKRRVPCPYCGKPLRSPLAEQCVECGVDWHKRPNQSAPAAPQK